jgi:multimeric flavodoxin WrbA
MNIAVINGSPKGEISVTVQYVKFIQKKFPQHELKLFNVSHDILKIEKDPAQFQHIIDQVRKADGVMWAFPLYVFLVPSQYKRFIEMIWENGVQDAFKDKYTCVLTTSVHFFDHTANNYMRGICEDLGMRFTEYFSADMDELFVDARRKILLKWADEFFSAIEFGTPVYKANVPIVHSKFAYKPGKAAGNVETRGKKIVVIADIEDEKSNIAKMVNRFAAAFKDKIEVFNVRDIDIKGGCLGCIQCGFDNVCVYGDKDDLMNFFNAHMRDNDVVIFAGAIKDRYFSSRLKMFWDRSFFNGHIPLQIDKQIGFIVSGPLAQLPNMQEIMLGQAEMSEANLAGVVTDESGDAAQIDALLDSFAGKCVDYAQHKYLRPRTFLGVGGHKIFRDQIWSRLRFPFDADFRFYEAHNMFDFPQNDTRYMEFSQQMIKMIQEPKMRETVRKMIKTEMLKNYAKVVETK